jgi:signal transduction histidine kinase
MRKLFTHLTLIFSRLILIGSLHPGFSPMEKAYVVRTNRIILILVLFDIPFTVVLILLSQDTLIIYLQIIWIAAIVFCQALKWVNLIFLSSNFLQITAVVAMVFYEKYFLIKRGQEGGFYLFLFISVLLRLLASESENQSTLKKVFPYSYPFLGFLLCFVDLNDPHGTIMLARQNISVMFYVNLSFTLFMLAFFLTQQRILNRRLTKKIEAKQIRIINLIKNNRKNDMKIIINTEERERQRFSKQLHEGVAQLLATAKANVDLLTEENKIEYPEMVISNSKQLIRLAMEEVKNISQSLMPAILNDLGFYYAIHDMCDKSHLKNGNRIVFCPGKNTEKKFKLDHEEFLHLYRIIQESVSNIIKHSTATYARIKINDVANELVLNITDNGCGFNSENIGQGNGLKNIRNRAEVINANVSIESGIQQGTNILVLLNNKKIN